MPKEDQQHKGRKRKKRRNRTLKGKGKERKTKLFGHDLFATKQNKIHEIQRETQCKCTRSFSDSVMSRRLDNLRCPHGREAQPMGAYRFEARDAAQMQHSSLRRAHLSVSLCRPPSRLSKRHKSRESRDGIGWIACE